MYHGFEGAISTFGVYFPYLILTLRWSKEPGPPQWGGGFRPDFIEHQLAHAVRDPNGRAYNRTAYLPERQKMMQEWADYLDQLKAVNN